MKKRIIYSVEGAKYECHSTHPELGSVKERIIAYATGKFEEIESFYNKLGYMKIRIKPVEIVEFPLKKEDANSKKSLEGLI